MKKTVLFILIPFVLLLLAGCSPMLPPNIPRTGGATSTAQPVGITATPSTPTETAAPPSPATSTSAPLPATNTPAAQNVPTNTPSGSSGAAGAIPLPSQLQTIRFVPNAASTVVTAAMQPDVTLGYQLYAQNGQHIWVTIDGNASVSWYDPHLVPFATFTATNPVRINLTETGNYSIAVRGTGPVTMSIYIPAPAVNWTLDAPIPPDLTPIQFNTGESSTVLNLTLTDGTPVGYSIAAQAGQTITVTSDGSVGAVIPFLFGQDSSSVMTGPAPTHQWNFAPLLKTQTYWLVLLGNGPVRVVVSIPPLNNPPAGGTVTPVPVQGTPTRVSFGAGNASASLNTTLVTGQPQAFVLNIQAGQTLYVSTTGSVDVTMYDPARNALVSGHSNGPNRWSAKASQAGDYIFAVAGNGACTLTFYVPPQ